MIHSYPFYITDWRESGSVLAMTAEQRDVYRNLLDMCWRDGSLPTDERALQKMALATDKEWRRSWPVVKGQFYQGDGQLWNAKVDEKRPLVLKSKEDRKRGADATNAIRMAKHQAYAERDAERDAERTPPPSPSPSPSPSQEDKEEYTAPDGADFSLSPPGAVSVTQTTRETQALHSKKGLKIIEVSEVESWFAREFWPIYPKKVAKGEALAAAKRKLTTEEKRTAAIDGLRRQIPTVEDPRFFRNGSTWINQSGWEDTVYMPLRRETKADRDARAFEDAMVYEAEVQQRLAGHKQITKGGVA